MRLSACEAKCQPRASTSCSITVRTSGRPSASAVASDIVCGSTSPAATTSPNHTAKSDTGSAGAAAGSNSGRALTCGSQTRSPRRASTNSDGRAGAGEVGRGWEGARSWVGRSHTVPRSDETHLSGRMRMMTCSPWLFEAKST